MVTTRGSCAAAGAATKAASVSRAQDRNLRNSIVSTRIFVYFRLTAADHTVFLQATNPRLTGGDGKAMSGAHLPTANRGPYARLKYPCERPETALEAAAVLAARLLCRRGARDRHRRAGARPL